MSTTPRLSLTLLAATLALGAACGAGPATPRTPLEAPLAGSWFTGTLSSLQLYDRVTGAIQDRSGEGFYFVFGPQGDYETGAIIESTVAGCRMRMVGVELGTVTQAGNQLTLYRDHVTTHAVNSCGSAGDHTEGPAVHTWTFAVEPDQEGREWLSLTREDGQVERYRRW